MVVPVLVLMAGPTEVVAELHRRFAAELPRSQVRGSRLLGGVDGVALLCWTLPEPTMPEALFLLDRVEELTHYWRVYIKRVQQADAVPDAPLVLFPEFE